jgi:signal transduction histidine kinase
MFNFFKDKDLEAIEERKTLESYLISSIEDAVIVRDNDGNIITYENQGWKAHNIERYKVGSEKFVKCLVSLELYGGSDYDYRNLNYEINYLMEKELELEEEDNRRRCCNCCNFKNK